MKLFVEGWRFISQSYAVVNQFQLLELLKRSHVELFHREMPYLQDWKPTTGLLSLDEEMALRNIPKPPKFGKADALLRMQMPFDFTPSPEATQTYIFGLTEYGKIHNAMLEAMNVSHLRKVHGDTNTVIITSSEWSRQGFIASGAEPSRVVVVPLGVDPKRCRPLPKEERLALRRKLGIDDYFVFLNVSSLHPRKGIRPLLKAFSQVVDRYPDARLILKGTTSLYDSRKHIFDAFNEVLTEAERERVIPRLSYVGKDLSFEEVIRLHQAADVYISPYLAEGFNLPVLESIACGNPVICTAGGPTDDFTRSNFALSVASEPMWLEISNEPRLILHPDLDALVAAMERSIEDSAFRQQASDAGVAFVEQNYTWSKAVDRLLGVFSSSMNSFADVAPVKIDDLAERDF
ncbi:MAG: glycosyltransferase [Cyanobacteria bacterium SID2]|nr:glycosyltransferase [Cyanobacteria bacterium SID2]MBP0006632.1 glycosyltransferase [Cyanobacteria bacterium SBC]